MFVSQIPTVVGIFNSLRLVFFGELQLELGTDKEGDLRSLIPNKKSSTKSNIPATGPFRDIHLSIKILGR